MPLDIPGTPNGTGIPLGGYVSYSGQPVIFPANPGENDTLVVTDTGDELGNTIETYVYDADSSTWSLQGGGAISSVTQTVTTGNEVAIHNDNDPDGNNAVSILETITDFGSAIVDSTTDPQNVEVTIPYNQEDGNVDNVVFTIPVPAPVSVVQSIDFKPGANPGFYTVEIVYIDDAGVTQTITDTTEVDLNDVLTVYTDTTTNPHKIGEYQDEEGVLTDVNENLTTLTENGDETALYTSEDATETRVMTPFDTTSILPVKSDLTAAQADVPANSASYIQLSTGELLKSGRVYFPGHGLNVNTEYYLDQSIAGGITDVKPTAGEIQAVLSAIDADRIEVQIQENYNTDVASFVSFLADDNARLALAGPKPDTVYVVLDSLNDGSNVNKTWVYDLVGTQWVELEKEYTLGTINVDSTDPVNPIVTVPLQQNGATVSSEDFTFNIPNPVSVVNSIDLTLNGESLEISLNYTDDEGNNEVVTDSTPVDLTQFVSVVTDTVTGNKIATHTANGTAVDINETVTSLARVGNTLTYTKEDGTTDELDELIPFTISAIDENSGVVGTQGLTFTAEAFNVVYPAITWSIDSFSGDIENVVIDPVTGEVAYDVVSILQNNGRGLVVIRAVDSIGQIQVTSAQIKSADPSSETTLACNGDIEVNSPDLVNKLILFAKADTSRTFQDLAKTIPATATGDPVSVLEDSTGSGDITVVAPDNPPTLSLSSINGKNTLQFSQAGQNAIQYQVPSAPAQGSPFKFFALVRLNGTSTNSSIIASTTVGNNDSTGNGTWQITDDDGFLAVRYAGGASNAVIGNIVGSTDTRSSITRAQMNDGNPHLCYMKYNGSPTFGGTNTVELYWDGVKVIEVDVNQPFFGQYLKLFENRGSGNWIDGELAEMLYANDSLTDAEAIEVQGYFLCKYGLDASLLAYASPFSVLDEFYDTTSQFVYQVLSDGTETVYDVVNNVYYDPTNVPTPGLGYFLDPALKSIRNQSIVDATDFGSGNTITFTKGDGSTFDVIVTP